MNYREIEVQEIFQNQKHIIIDNGNGTFKSFPADPNNPEYVAFLKALEKEAE